MDVESLAYGSLALGGRRHVGHHRMGYANAHHGTANFDQVYPGRYKRFLVQDEDHFHVVFRYVKRNALTAEIVKQAQDYRWGSLANWLTSGSKVSLARHEIAWLSRARLHGFDRKIAVGRQEKYPAQLPLWDSSVDPRNRNPVQA